MLGTLPTQSRELLRDVSIEHAVTLVLLGLAAVILQRTMSLSALFAAKVVVVAVIGGAVTLSLALKRLPSASFGAANRVTLVRAGLVALLCGLIGEAGAGWLVVALATAVLALDGVDGWLARRLDCASEYGARFDMETDALALLVLTVLVWQDGKAGAWVLLAGLLRYVFVAAATVLPRLGAPLPPSRRRKIAFVLAVIALLACAAPLVTPPASEALALGALGLLGGSFGIDVVYLARARDRRSESARA